VLVARRVTAPVPRPERPLDAARLSLDLFFRTAPQPRWRQRLPVRIQAAAANRRRLKRGRHD
jgi:hypothetical protein